MGIAKQKQTGVLTQSSRSHQGKEKVSVLQKKEKQVPFVCGYFEYFLFLNSFQTQTSCFKISLVFTWYLVQVMEMSNKNHQGLCIVELSIMMDRTQGAFVC